MKESTATARSGPKRSGEVDRALLHRTNQAGRREGLHPTVYYAWVRDFMEAGKARTLGDSLREATTAEVRPRRQDNELLKQLVADVSLANLALKERVSYESSVDGARTTAPDQGSSHADRSDQSGDANRLPQSSAESRRSTEGPAVGKGPFVARERLHPLTSRC